MIEGEQVPSFLLVDGNNILHAWEDLRPALRQGVERARAELIRRLVDWSDDADERLVLVFDGGRKSQREEQRQSGIQVIFGSAGETADVVIERLVSKYAGTYRLIVATDDRSVDELAAAAGAETLSSIGLHQLLASGARHRSEWLRKHRRKE